MFQSQQNDNDNDDNNNRDYYKSGDSLLVYDEINEKIQTFGKKIYLLVYIFNIFITELLIFTKR